MILVDTSVWIEHLRAGDEGLAALLVDSRVLSHPFVVGEVFLGQLRQRNLVLDAMKNLPRATIANDDEVLHFIARHSLFGTGIGYVDAHLLAATKLTDGARIWTRDKRLRAAAAALSLAMEP